MAMRLADLVVRGELFNTRSYSVHGWLELQGAEQPLVLELTGNCSPDLRGWHIRFENRNPPPGEDCAGLPELGQPGGEGPGPQQELRCEGPAQTQHPDDVPPFAAPFLPLGLAWQQVGPTGTMTAARKVRVAPCPPKGLCSRREPGEPPTGEWKRCLHLEWFSQNGRVVLVLPDPILEFVEKTQWNEPSAEDVPSSVNGDAPPSQPSEPQNAAEGRSDTTSIRLDEDGNIEVRDESPLDKDETPDDPYRLFPTDLERQFEAEALATDQAIQDDDDKPQCVREAELLDHLIETSEGVTLDELFDGPLKLPLPEQLDDEQVEGALKTLLTQLALFGIALDVCEHYTPRAAYKLLLDQICREERAYPELRNTQWVQHFATSDFCPRCEAKFEQEFQDYERRRKDGGQSGLGDTPPEQADDWDKDWPV
jgi:hypothetical protein